jgi:hypothetical protein
MSYSLTLSNGTSIPGLGSAGLQDGTVDTGSTSLSLIGKNYPGYGKLLNENFVYLLENFANTKSPLSALPGQIWWDSGAKVLKVNTAAAAGNPAIWKSLSSMYNADPITDAATGTVGTPKYLPYAPVVGDLWWDTANRQLKLFTGAVTGTNAVGNGGWLTIGPVNNTTTGQTGATPDTILDNTGLSRIVIKFYIQDKLIAILSKEDEFTPGTLISGFTTVKPGFTLSQDPGLPTLEYFQTANVALNLMVGNTIVSASSFARNDVTTSSNVQLSTASNDGIKIGTVGDVVIDVDPLTGTGRVRHTVSGKNLSIYINQLGTSLPVFTANGVSGHAEVTSSPLNSNDIANKFYVDNTALARNGSNTITGALIPSANAAVNLGSTTSWFANIYGVSMQAKYADLAERFAADAEYEAGTVVEIGGSAEITAASADLSEKVFGVISTKAAYLMNAGSGDDTTHPPVALSGRVPVKVIGIIRKGDRLVSAGNGIARAGTNEEITPWNVIGRALQDKESDELSLIEAIVKINN